MSLAFESLDRRVIDGRGDETAIRIGTDQLTFAQLVGHSAAIAGGLRLLGLGERTPVALRLAGVERIVVVWALARMHALPAADAPNLIEGEPPQVTVGDDTYALAAIEEAGQSEPAGAPRSDPTGYRARMQSEFPDIFRE